MVRIDVDEETVREVFGQVAHHTAFDQSREIFERGVLPAEMLQAMTLRPEILSAFGEFSGCVYPGGLLERRLKEKVIVKASELNNCQFCSFSHRALMLRLNMIPTATTPVEVEQTERERLALVYTVEMMNDSKNISESLHRELRAMFSQPEIVELTFLVGYINMLNLFNNALGIEYRDDYELPGE